MHETDEPETDETERSPQDDEGPAVDAELDALEAAFDTVDSALTAIDADDLDQAEALAASLDEAAEPSSSSSVEG